MEPHEVVTRTPKTRLQQQFHHLQELLACQICYCKAHQPTLCPHCSKLYCHTCITKSLTLKPQCPNCRQSIKIELSDCSRFLNQLTSLMSNLFEQQEQIEKCSQHRIILNYFCLDCGISCCCECKMFGIHQTHTFKAIEAVYKQKYDRIRELLSILKLKIIQKQELLTDIQNNLISIKTHTQAQISEVEQFTQKYSNKVALQSVSRNHTQQQVAAALSHQINQLQQLRQTITQKVEQANKTHRYKVDPQFINQYESVLNKSKEMLAVNQKGNSLDEASPPYFRHSLIICSFHQMQAEDTVIDGGVIQYEASKWHLRVHPNGSTLNQGHLSVLIELLSNPDQINQYDILIQVIHPCQTKKNIVRQYQALFQVGESWGYGKLAGVDQLKREGFLQNDQVYLTVGIRLSYYYQLYKRRCWKLQQLQSQIKEQKRQIEQLQTRLQQESSTSIKLV